ncbi:hypothetical protein TNCV_1541051 [Trichonephila clavipes]|nr:hypothetical protein TNCV_1541051 [Trichonephila clavipes]
MPDLEPAFQTRSHQANGNTLSLDEFNVPQPFYTACFRQHQEPNPASCQQLALYTRAFSDGLRNLEPWSSDVDDTLAGTPSPNYHTTPTGGRFSPRQI